MKPKILISGSKIENYSVAVNNCGGIAFGGYCPEFSKEYDALILAGGSDVNPRYYNEEICGSKNIDDKRDEAEFELIEVFIKSKKPIFGICRGCQLINIYFGGNMYQDIPNHNEHHSGSDYDLVHNVNATCGSFLSNLYGNEFSVNSRHHQAISIPGSGIDIVAKTSDGTTVEAIAHRELPVIGVQWHPERMCFDNKREDTVDGSEVFKYFINLCKGFK